MLTIEQTQLRAIRNSLRFEGTMPPREAVAAVFALSNPTGPDQVVSSRECPGGDAPGSVDWHVLARAGTGLAVVTATADEPWQWGDHEPPQTAHLEARWVPLSAVSSVGIRELRVFRDQFGDSGEFSARFDWTLRLSHQDPIVFTPDGVASTADRHRAFFESLLSEL